MLAPTHSYVNSAHSTKTIIVLEGLDGTGKTALAKQLLVNLGEQASILNIEPFQTTQQEKTKELYYQKVNAHLNEEIAKDFHNVIIFDRSWLSGEATRCAKENDKVKRWPKDLYKPTHIFLLTLPEEIRLKYMENRLKEKPYTEEEIRLRDDEKYRENYQHALQEGALNLKTSTIYRAFDSSLLSIQEIAQKIVGLLDKNLNLLDPRKMTIRNKQILSQLYQSWKQRLDESKISHQKYLKITFNVTEGQTFDPSFRSKYQCHFDNIGKIFNYQKFAEARHPPVPISTLDNKREFDRPLDVEVIQAQDMPIAFPAQNQAAYEYRLPKSYKNLQEFVQKVATAWHSLEPEAYKYYAYLSISFGTIPPWQAQRRPGIHCDGFQSARISPKEVGEYTFVASNALPTVFYIESFDTSTLDPAKDDFFVTYSQTTEAEPLDCQPLYEIMMMDPYCLHAAVSNTSDSPVNRTFVRIIYSTRQYDRLGNTHNPAFDYNWNMVRREAQQDLS